MSSVNSNKKRLKLFLAFYSFNKPCRFETTVNRKAWQLLTLFCLSFLRVAQLGGGGGGRKVPAAYISKTINDNEMKFGGVVKHH